ncbi:MAG: hypothetical protein JO112_08645, partial [Planctomycetes bacterium]|nr:hypothetical protein [Planctomycetota bacterium]
RGTPPAAPPSVDTITGTLARVEEAERKIVVLSSGSKEGDFSEADVSVPEEARITRNRQPIALEDLREGEQVSVFTAQRRGRLTALEIRAGKTEMRADTQVPPGDRLQLFLRLGHWVLQQMAARNPR